MKDPLKVLNEGRVSSAAFILCALVGQAMGLGLAAVGTRDAFAALRSDLAAIIEPMFLLIIGACGVALFQFLAQVEAERLGYAFARRLRTALYDQYARMPISEIRKRRLGSLSLRFVGDLTAARGWAGAGMTRAAAAAIILPAAALSLWLLNPALAYAAAPPIFVSLFVMIAIGWRQENRHRGLRRQRARIASSMMERVAMAPQLDLLGRTAKEIATLEAKNEELSTLAVRRIRPSTLMRLCPDIGVAVAGALIFLVAALQEVSSPDVAGGLAALAILARPLRDLAGAWDKFCAWRVARGKCELILNAPTMARDRNDKARSTALWVKDLAIGDGAPLSFETGHAGIFHLNHPANDELIDCLSGLDKPPSGRVLFLNQRRGARRPRVALVTRQAPILSGSFRRALTLGADRRPSDETIEHKARIFGFDETLARFGGLDGRLAEQSKGLTAAEQLRLLLTRATLTTPSFVVIEGRLLLGESDPVGLVSALSETLEATILIVGDEVTSSDWADVLHPSGPAFEKRIA